MIKKHVDFAFLQQVQLAPAPSHAQPEGDAEKFWLWQISLSMLTDARPTGKGLKCGLRMGRLRSVAAWLGVLSGFAGATELCAAEFEVEGSLAYRSFHVDGTPLRTMQRSYLAVVHDSAWYIETRDTAPTKDMEELVSWESGSDGVDVYNFERYDGKERVVDFAFPDGRGGLTQAKTNMVVPKGVAKVTSGPIPHPWIDCAAQVWLAFGSSGYLNTNSSGRLRPVWTFDDPNLLYSDFRIEAQHTLSKAPPHLPASVVYFSDGKVYGNRDGRSVVVPRPKPYDQRWTNAIYEVLEWRTVDGLSIPAKFRLTRFAPAKNGTGPEQLRVVHTVEGETSVVRSRRNRESLLPDLPAGVPVMDHRFYSSVSAPLAYASTNGWLDVPGVKNFPDFQARVKGARLQAMNRTPRSRYGWLTQAAYWALIAVLIWPVATVIFRRIQKNHPSPTA